ncbi:uncharacterized protein [Rutidosis leptorrhynchoides]|uniref:uncharacterized protein n=1 Tax=Rutidosis leptorrhynchoides TaxID=125765 RepID=UPI003A994A95
MADFMVECICATPPASTVEEAPDIITWELFTDGASSTDGAGAGLILTGPEGEEHTYALRFTFHASNNEAEYEALLSGLRIDEKMGIKALKVSVDSQLVSNQMNETFEARDLAMQKYLKLAEDMANKFEHFSITQEVAPVEEVDTWISPIILYLKHGTLPVDRVAARKIRMKAPSYTLKDGVLFKKSFTEPLLRCIGPNEAETIIREVHEGTCGMHAGFRTVVGKIMRLGYYWPSMYRDTEVVVKACASCQRHAPQIHMPPHELIPVTSAWPFYKWAINLVGAFSDGKHLVVAIDFFTKWVEAKPLKSITGKQIVNFVWEEIVCRFGIPHEIGSGVGWTQIGKAGLMSSRKSCGLFQTTPKGSNRETPFSLVYGSEAVIPAEIAVPTQRVLEFNDESNIVNLKENLDLLEERHEITAIREASNKQKISKYYNQRVKDSSFRPGDYVWRNNNASWVEDTGKLGPKWEGPCVVVDALGNGAYNLKTHDGKFVPRIWNATNLKKFYV